MNRDVRPVHLLAALLPAADSPAADGLAAAGHHAGHDGRLFLRLLASRPSKLDDNAREVLLGGELSQKQLALQVAASRDGDVILVFLAFVGDAEPPGLGLLEFAQSPDERNVPVVGVALNLQSRTVSIGTGLPVSASTAVPWISYALITVSFRSVRPGATSNGLGLK